MTQYLDYKKANDVDVEYILELCGMKPDKYGRYNCPFHNDTRASSYITGVNRLFCFACENEDGFDGWSNIEIVKKCFNVEKEDAVKIILKLATGNVTSFKNNESISNEKNRRLKEKSINDEYENIREGFLEKAREIKESDDIILKNYLQERKIDQRVLSILDKNNVLYGNDRFGQPGFIFNFRHCVFRNLRANENHSSVITRGAGSYAIIKSNPIPIFYVVEGIYDALTLLDRKNPPNVICLNSIKNTDVFINDTVSDWNNKKNIYILALDNDERGIKSKIKIENAFLGNNIRFNPYIDLINNPNCKDVNELRMNGII